MDEVPTSEFLENEKFDFDLAFSPNVNQDQLNKPAEVDEEEEVFFGPVGFTEQCVATRAKTLQEEDKIKPLSPLTGEQVVEIFKEATKVALRFEKLSSAQSPISSLSSGSLSSSILKLSSTGSESPSWLTGKLSSGSSDGASRFESDKENIQPFSEKVENIQSFSRKGGHLGINECHQTATNDKNVSLAYKSDKIGPNISGNEKNISIIDGKIEYHFDEENIRLNKNEKNSLTILEERKISDNIKQKTSQDGDKNVQDLSTEENLSVVKNGQHEPVKLGNLGSFTQENEEVKNKKVLGTEVVDTKVAGTKEMNKTNMRIPVVRSKGSGLPKPGFRNSRLPKSKNTQKSQSAFNSPIRSGSSKKRETWLKSDNAAERSETSKSSSSKLQKSVPAKLPQDAGKVTSRSSKTLAKRNIFNSSESLDKLGEKHSKAKTLHAVTEQSKIPGLRPRRRRSSSLSSLDSSQSSASSQASQDDNATTKLLLRPSTKIPTTKTAIASSFGLVRRSKLQDATAEKKVQPLKALPRPGFTSSAKNSKPDTKVAKEMPPPPPPTEEMKKDKIPMAATPKSSSSSLPVAKRRSSFKSSLSSTSSREGSPPRYFTPSRPAGRRTEPRGTSSTCKRRSTKPTPNHSAPSSASRRILRSSGDDNMLLSLSPASKSETTKKTNRKLIPDNDPPSTAVTCFSTQTVDDLLDCDDDAILGDIVPIQPQSIPEADLIDLSDL